MNHARTTLSLLGQADCKGHTVDRDRLRTKQIEALRELSDEVNDLREDMPDALDEELADIECVLDACADALEADDVSQGAINERALGGGGS